MYCGDENCYEILGIERGASTDLAAIKKAYRKLSLQWHPDKAPGSKEEATKKFQSISMAYEVLSKDDLRAAYDYALDHPEKRMYNRMRYYRVMYTPSTPVWCVLIGVLVFMSVGQFFHYREQEKTFEQSPEFLKYLEEEYMKNCKGGRHGYQTGEMTPAKKAEVRAVCVAELSQDPTCPLGKATFANTFLPCLFFYWPVGAVKWAAWRVQANGGIQAEKARVAAEQKAEEEEEEREEAERTKLAEEKERKRAAGAAHLAKRQTEEEEKRRRWAEEAEREAAESEDKAEELTVQGLLTSVSEMRKKGHFLLEVAYGDDGRAQIVVEREGLVAGQKVTVALEGATLENGKTVKRSKIAGEWNEGVLLEAGDAPITAAGLPPAEDDAADAEEELKDAPDEKEGKARQRKKDKKK